MGDFKNAISGSRYLGPSDDTLISYITNFGTRDSSSYEDIILQFGLVNKAKIEKQLDRLCREGKIEAYINKWQIFIKPLSVYLSP